MRWKIKKKEKEEDVVVVGDNDDEDSDVNFVRVTPSHHRDRLRRKLRNREVTYVKTNPAHPRYRSDCILRNWPVNIEVDAEVLKELPYFNAKIKVGEINKIKRPNAIFDAIVKQLPPNNDTYYIDHGKSTDTFRLKKDHKIKINDDSGDDVKFLKQTPSHPCDRLACKTKKRRSTHLANKKVRETETGPVVMPTGALLAVSKIKRKYAKSAKNAVTKKLLKLDKELSKKVRRTRDPEKRKALELWMHDNIKKELINLHGGTES